VSSGLLRRVALVRTQKTPLFIVTAVKTSNLNNYQDVRVYKMELYNRWTDTYGTYSKNYSSVMIR
jgi:hypothetical protein